MCNLRVGFMQADGDARGGGNVWLVLHSAVSEWWFGRC